MNKSYQETRNLFEDYKDRYFKDHGPFMEGMEYALESGKRLRPVIMIESFKLFSKDEEKILPFALALEFVHNYSLVHDDLPAMDDDDYRRGNLTVHKKYGEARGILIGDALLTEAFKIMSGADFDAPIKIRAIEILAKKSGQLGMIRGQDLDIKNDFNNLEDLLNMYECKTSCLIEAASSIGALASGAAEEDIESLSQFGRYLGLAFQIQDDLLDRDEDESIKKVTSLTFISPGQARDKIEYYSSKAIDQLKGYSGSSFLNDLVNDLIDRDH